MSETALAPYRVTARNTAIASDNKIHDDAVARRFGFAGGLVPGVDVYAYLTHAPAEAWGLDWLERGTMQGRFTSPVYEGDTITVTTVEHVERDGGPAGRLVARHPAAVGCGTPRASLADPAANPS